MKLITIGTLIILSSVSLTERKENFHEKSTNLYTFSQEVISKKEMLFKISKTSHKSLENQPCSSVKCWKSILEKETSR